MPNPPSHPETETPPPVALRFSRNEWPAVSEAASARGLSVGQFARASAVAAAGAADATQRLSAASRRHRQLPPEDVAEASRLAAWVSRLNGAVVQLTVGEREAGHAEAHAKLEALLRDLRSAQLALVGFVDRLS